jgi:hypothetical protein
MALSRASSWILSAFTKTKVSRLSFPKAVTDTIDSLPRLQFLHTSLPNAESAPLFEKDYVNNKLWQKIQSLALAELLLSEVRLSWEYLSFLRLPPEALWLICPR